MKSTFSSTHNAMTKKLITAKYDDSVRKAYEVMQENKIRHLPITDSSGAIIGILSDRDVQRAITPQTEPEFSSYSTELVIDSSLLVKDFMSWPIEAINEAESLEVVCRRMLTEKKSAYLVTDAHNNPRGIITTDDLIRVLLELLSNNPSSKRLDIRSQICAN